jgi:hypothetical protein
MCRYYHSFKRKLLRIFLMSIEDQILDIQATTKNNTQLLMGLVTSVNTLLNAPAPVVPTPVVDFSAVTADIAAVGVKVDGVAQQTATLVADFIATPAPTPAPVETPAPVVDAPVSAPDAPASVDAPVVDTTQPTA